ncbi:MAG: hypothetical protein PHD95_00380 [Candidatus ainarchaeum sp.]|nr:hypothetical protein [Candidatus ainarchaeum sp.]
MQEEFRLVSNTELAGPLRHFVEAIFAKHISNPGSLKVFISNGGQMKGIARGNVLIGFCAFMPLGNDSVLISQIWTNTKSVAAREFKRDFGRTPTEYLFGDFLRKGISHFHHLGVTALGARFLARLEKNALVAKKQSGFEITNRAIEKAKKTRQLRPLRVIH